MKRIRIHYAKTEGLRYTSNLDMQKVWERALRRAGLRGQVVRGERFEC